MKRINYFFALLGAACFFVSCSTENSSKNNLVKDFQIDGAVTSPNSVTLQSEAVPNCNWFRIYVSQENRKFEEYGLFQKTNGDVITYSLPSLAENTTYNIKIEGTDFATGGKLLAKSNVITVHTP